MKIKDLKELIKDLDDDGEIIMETGISEYLKTVDNIDIGVPIRLRMKHPELTNNKYIDILYGWEYAYDIFNTEEEYDEYVNKTPKCIVMG